MSIIIEAIIVMGIIVVISFIFLAKKYRGGDDKDKQIAKMETKAIIKIYIVFVLILLLLLAMTTEKIPAEYLTIITIILVLINIVSIAILLIYLNRWRNKRQEKLKMEKTQ